MMMVMMQDLRPLLEEYEEDSSTNTSLVIEDDVPIDILDGYVIIC